jgi:hypothetical protein
VITDAQIAEWTRRSVEQVINCKTEDLRPQDVLNPVSPTTSPTTIPTR